MPFGENHKRRLLSSFQHVDHLLAEAYARLGPAATDGDCLFPGYVADATPVQRQTIGDYLVRFRHLARRFLDRQGIVDERPPVSALWAFRTALAYAVAGLDEIAPGRLAGYGPVAPELACDTERALAELRAVLEAMRNYLESGCGGDLGARLAQLDRTSDEVALLRELERIVARHGLIEFRAHLDWLTSKFEQDWLEIAVFGRVSSGKSSLLNALLEAPVLPVGVTPVTAVPTRIAPGEVARATVRFATGAPLEIGLERLAEFVCEKENPDNAKRVADVVVELPSARLASGVCLVDTPGLGALAAAGMAQTWAWLPRCDIGLLLIDATAPISAEDIAVAGKIVESGAELHVALNKCDLLDSGDLARVVAYARRALDDAGLPDAPLSTVSAADDDGARARAWFAQALAPRLRVRQALLAASRRRKVGALRQSVIAALRALGGAAPGLAGAVSAALDAALAEGRRILETARRAVADAAFAARRAERVAAMQRLAADALAQAWRADFPETEARAAVARALAGEMEQTGARIERLVGDARSTLAGLLKSAADARTDENDMLLAPCRGRPLFDPSPLVGKLPTDVGVLALFGEFGRRHDAGRRVARALDGLLARQVTEYAGRLERWAGDNLNRLEREFAAASAGSSVLSRIAATSGDAGSAAVAADLRGLEAWNEGESSA